MIKQNLIIYSIPILYEILEEIKKDINYEIIQINSQKELFKKDISDCLILTHKKKINLVNEINIKLPIHISKLIEKINIEFLKIKTKEKTSVEIGEYELNLNARILKLNSKFIELTEKEINLIMFLKNSENSVSVEKLQSEVWNFKKKLETHTVETHIHRLRKKIFTNFENSDFILNDKNGYYLKK